MFKLRREKRTRRKRPFSIGKIKTISFVHARYILIQAILAGLARLLFITNHEEPRNFLILSLIVCGCFAFPAITTKTINRLLIRDHESSGVWGNWILHISVCFGLIRTIIPFKPSSSWTIVLTVSVALSFLLLLLSTKRTTWRPRKQTP